MKRLIALLLSFIVASPVFAKNETDKNEFSITYGQITVPQAAYVLGGVFGSMFSLGHFSFEDAHFIGGVGVEYVHYVNDWLGFGGAVLCDYVTANAVNVAKDGTKTPNGKFNLGIVSAMPAVKFAWYNREHVGLYSKLAAGAGFTFTNQSSDTKDNFAFAFQATLIGMDFGGDMFRGFAELGIGMQGLVNAGVRWFF